MTEDVKWYLWLDGGRSPFENMAIDELLLKRAAEEQFVMLRLYGWDRPAVSIGYVQDYLAAPQQGYTVVRRPTGGGVVFHDVDLTYTVVVPKGHSIEVLDRMESYNVFHRAVLAAAAQLGVAGSLADAEMPPVDRATMQCFVTPTRYDVLCGNRKIAGSAQRRTQHGILHQGSIILKETCDDKVKLQQALIHAFEQSFAVTFLDYTPSISLLEEALVLAEQKYSQDDWNRKR